MAWHSGFPKGCGADCLLAVRRGTRWSLVPAVAFANIVAKTWHPAQLDIASPEYSWFMRALQNADEVRWMRAPALPDQATGTTVQDARVLSPQDVVFEPAATEPSIEDLTLDVMSLQNDILSLSQAFAAHLEQHNLEARHAVEISAIKPPTSVASPDAGRKTQSAKG